MQISGGAAVNEVLVSMSIPPSFTAVNGGCCGVGGLLRSPELRHRQFQILPFSHSLKFNRWLSSGIPKLGIGTNRCRARGLTVRATEDLSGNSVPVAPLEFESPIGQLLAQILKTHGHLLSSTIDQQLENLKNAKHFEERDSPSSPDILHRRISELKVKERGIALEEIIYFLIVQKFMDKDITMIPKVSATSDPTGRVDFWPNQEQKLESVFSPEAFEMIQSHLSLVLGDRLVGALDTIVQISKIKLGKLYAASIMYGYFLRRVDERFQLDRSMGTLPEGYDENRARFEDPTPSNMLWDPDSLIRISVDDDGDPDIRGISGIGEEGLYRLRSYVMYLDPHTLQRYATIRSKEAIHLIERQTQALFGRPDIRVADDGSLDIGSDEVVSLTYSGLAMLVLEAVAFGSFMWDAESHAETIFPFLES